MAKFTGKIRHSDLEGGFYELVSDDGKVYRIEGALDVDDGARVRVHGRIDSGAMGIHMSGPAITVERIEHIGAKKD